MALQTAFFLLLLLFQKRKKGNAVLMLNNLDIPNELK